VVWGPGRCGQCARLKTGRFRFDSEGSYLVETINRSEQQNTTSKVRLMQCLFCQTETNNPKYCSLSCSAKANNRKFPKRTSKRVPKSCVHCGAAIDFKSQKFCSNRCRADFDWVLRKNQIAQTGVGSGKHLKRYLIEEYGEVCMECGWGERNVASGCVMIELEHIDGNNENNTLSNVKLLCPNCHSLTPTYRSLNIGNGRKSRRVNRG
jgi:endogenous inhibitor of DNA gyrase (YacG/DUF329 family)